MPHPEIRRNGVADDIRFTEAPILIVDDEENSREIIRGCLGMYNCVFFINEILEFRPDVERSGTESEAPDLAVWGKSIPAQIGRDSDFPIRKGTIWKCRQNPQRYRMIFRMGEWWMIAFGIARIYAAASGLWMVWSDRV